MFVSNVLGHMVRPISLFEAPNGKLFCRCCRVYEPHLLRALTTIIGVNSVTILNYRGQRPFQAAQNLAMQEIDSKKTLFNKRKQTGRP